jgi:hypothetical protein
VLHRRLLPAPRRPLPAHLQQPCLVQRPNCQQHTQEEQHALGVNALQRSRHSELLAGRHHQLAPLHLHLPLLPIVLQRINQ